MTDSLNIIIAPSILSSDFAQLANECERMVNYGADWLHVDVMDGHFVPNLTLGPPIVKSLRKHTKAFLDCHLMVSNPDQWIDDFAAAGASSITFHIETKTQHEECVRLIQKIKQANMKVGISIKPNTPVDTILSYCNDIDVVLIMTVEPGFGGQSFKPEMITKIQELRKQFPKLIIEVDGGINETTALECAKAGANAFVAGNAIFGAPDPKQALENIRKSGEEGKKVWNSAAA